MPINLQEIQSTFPKMLTKLILLVLSAALALPAFSTTSDPQHQLLYHRDPKYYPNLGHGLPADHDCVNHRARH
ncbi:hypothetical protein DSO57_1036948 [Entomophthora muscae]|uniref:Uncharacterized protein n=1 Tax=Entomophthora muscae TaxID=34485 RepID=A0ACC2SN99_9FUNG|nr:hypothetical protein DSO57_1036948 [Entomophthora muscae]